MPVLAGSALSPTTTTVQQILNCASQDMRGVLNPNFGATQTVDQALLIDYTSRITLELLRHSRWKFLLSAPQVFLTVPGVTDYYIGDPSAQTPGSVNTGLALTNVDSIKRDDFIDRTAFKRLAKTDDPPIGQEFQLPGKPKLWRNDSSTPYVLNIYPPPVLNTYQFVPAAAFWTMATSGALALRTYYIRLTFTDNALGESAPSIEQVVTIPAGQLLTIKSPVLPITTDGLILQTSSGPTIATYNIYASTTSGNERLQVSGTPLGTDWTEPLTGLTTSGAGAPGSNTLAQLGGYLLEFKYYQTRATLTNVNQVIQIPDVYKDIVCAGVNWLAFKYLQMDEEAQIWRQVFESGKVQMIKDANLFPRGEEFIRPDATAIQRNTTTGIGLDSGLETSIP